MREGESRFSNVVEIGPLVEDRDIEKRIELLQLKVSKILEKMKGRYSSAYYSIIHKQSTKENQLMFGKSRPNPEEIREYFYEMSNDCHNFKVLFGGSSTQEKDRMNGSIKEYEDVVGRVLPAIGIELSFPNEAKEGRLIKFPEKLPE